MQPVPLIILGAGSIGARHIQVATVCPAVDLVAVVEPDPARRRQLSQNGLPMVADLDAVPGHAMGAIVATPTADHAQSAAACLSRGLAVLVEKPIAHTDADAQRLIDQADKAALPFFVGHHRRCHPFSIRAREMLADLGTLVGVQGLWSLRKHDSYFDVDWRTRAGAGPLMTNLSHEVDLLQFLMGPITEVTALTSAHARQLAVEDSAALSFRFASGALGSFLISDAGLSPWAFEAATGENPAIARSDQDYLRMTGTKGALAFPSLTLWGGPDQSGLDWTTPLPCRETPSSAEIDPLLDQVTRFAHVLNGGADDILCTGGQGLRALRIVLAAAQSASLGGAAVNVD